MKCREKLKMEHPEKVGQCYIGGYAGCPHEYGYLPRPDYCGDAKTSEEAVQFCTECWDRDIPEENKFPLYPIDTEEEKNLAKDLHQLWPKENPYITDAKKKADEFLGILPATAVIEPRASIAVDEPRIKDSGDRTQFETGAVRDMREGKGRCDLMPLRVVGTLMRDPIFTELAMFQETGDINCLYRCLMNFSKKWDDGKTKASLREMETQRNCTMLLEVSKHFEEGAKKYGENNWQKGIPVHCYIDSAVRHYLKWLRGDKDEPHDRAFVWNLMCCIWEVDYHKEG